MGSVTMPSLHADLRAALGDERVRTADTEVALYDRDASLTRAGRAAVVCLPRTTAEVQACVRAARRHGAPFVARGSGTGLAGGAVPVDGAVVIVTTAMDHIVEVDVDARVAWVEPGVLNLDLTRAVAGHGLHFAPDPSSQQACTVGGNVANNSGGPHCLSYGVTSAHVLAIEVVLPDGEITVLGGLEPEPPGYDLRGAFVGSEGTLGIATRIAVRLTPDPPLVRTVLVDFDTVDDAAACVSAIIAAGLVPAALEMLTGGMIAAVEDFVHAGFPVDAAAVLLAEVDGLEHEVWDGIDLIEHLAEEHAARSWRVNASPEEGRCAIGRAHV